MVDGVEGRGKRRDETRQAEERGRMGREESEEKETEREEK